MGGYILKRVGLAVAVALAVSMIAFLLLRLSGDPAIAIAGEGARSEDIEMVRKTYVFDRPLPVQYVDGTARRCAATSANRIQFPKNGHYCFAFVTGMTKGETTVLGEDTLIHVYVPTSPNPTSAYVLLVPEREVTSVEISIRRGDEADCIRGVVHADRRHGLSVSRGEVESD